jgi:hypothetical protein
MAGLRPQAVRAEFSDEEWRLVSERHLSFGCMIKINNYRLCRARVFRGASWRFAGKATRPCCTQIEEVEVAAADTALFPMGVGAFGS